MRSSTLGSGAHSSTETVKIYKILSKHWVMNSVRKSFKKIHSDAEIINHSILAANLCNF